MKRIIHFLLVSLLTFIIGCYVFSTAIAGEPRRAYYSEENTNIFWFLLISDVHIGRSGSRDRDNLNWATGDGPGEARQVINPKFIINAGDLVNGGSSIPWEVWRDEPYEKEWKEYREQILDPNGINDEIYTDAPGNHDQYYESKDDPLRFYRQYSIQIEPQRSWVLGPEEGIIFGKYHFITIATPDPDYTNPFWDWWDDFHGDLSDEEIDFIRNALDENKDANLTFIFGHHGLQGWGAIEGGREEFSRLLGEYGVSIYGYGHTHAGEEVPPYFVNSDSSGKFLPSLAFNVNSLWEDSRYAIIAVDNDGVSLAHVNVNQWPVVLITTPIDKKLGGINPYAYPVPASKSNPIRALVFNPNPVIQVYYRIDGGEPKPMEQVSTSHPCYPYLWQTTEWDATSLPPGDHTIRVEIPETEEFDEITVEIQSEVIPIPDIRVNSSDGPITLNQSDTMTVSVVLDNNGRVNNADWWLAADTPLGLYFFTFDGWTTNWLPAYQGPLFYLDLFEVLNMPVLGLPAGTYTLYFGIDTVMDGNVTWDSAYYDSVVVDVSEECM